jgi:hypothetical protein
MDIEIGHKIHTHILNYFNVPFRCVRYHLYGHVVVNCKKSFLKKVWTKNVEVVKGPTETFLAPTLDSKRLNKLMVDHTHVTQNLFEGHKSMFIQIFEIPKKGEKKYAKTMLQDDHPNMNLETSRVVEGQHKQVMDKDNLIGESPIDPSIYIPKISLNVDRGDVKA